MKNLIAAAAVAAMGLTAAGAAQAAESRVQVGVLTCETAPGVGLIFGSSKAVDCVFTAKGKKPEHYSGSIDKLGIDLGVTAKTKIAWLVFAATKDAYTPKALAGNYVGASTEATLGVGLGGNWLIGGSNKSFALQPWSIQGQVGVNVSWTWTKLSLH